MNPPLLTLTGPETIRVDPASAPPVGSAPIDRFDLRYSTDETTWTEIQGIAAPETLGGLQPDTVYFVATRAVNAVGAGPWSVANTVRTNTLLSSGAAPPEAFTVGDWTLTDDGNGGGITVTVLSLPVDGGAAISALEYQINGGGWIPLGGATTGAFQFFFLAAQGTEANVAIRAVNAEGAGPASDVKSVTPTFGAVALSGAVLGRQDLLRGVAITPIDVSVLFTGSVSAYDVDPTSPAALPEGLSIAPSGLITGTPTNASDLSELPSVTFRATGPSGSVTEPNGVIFCVKGPFLEALSVQGNTLSLSSDTGDGTVHLWFGTSQTPTDAEIIAGSGTGFLEERDFAVTASGGVTTAWDLSTHAGVGGYLFALQVAASGAYSNRLFMELTPRIPVSAPAAFGEGDWFLTDAQTGGTVTVTIANLPDDGNSALTSLEYRVDGGAWTTLSAAPGTGSFDITGLVDDTQVSIALRARNGIGAAPASAAKSVTPTFGAVALSGVVLGRQDLLRGVAITPIDVSVLFTGSVSAYDVDPTSPAALPEGLSIAPSGLITGTPTNASDLSELPSVTFRATGPSGSVTEPNGVIFCVKGPFLEALSVQGNTLSLSSDTGDGTVHLWFGTSQTPTDAEIIAGSGTGFLEERDFAVTASGGVTTAWDLSTHAGVGGYLFALQVAASGAYSNRLFMELTPRVPVSAPAAFGEGDWFLTDAQTGGTVTVTIANLPDDGNSALTSLEYRVDGGAWTTLSAAPGTGSFDITGLVDDTQVTIALRARNGIGAAPASAAKTVTPTGLPAIVLSNYLQDVTVAPVAISFDAGAASNGETVYLEVHDAQGNYPGRGLGALGSHNLGVLSSGPNIKLETGLLTPYAGQDVVLYLTVGAPLASTVLEGALFTVGAPSQALADPDGTVLTDPDGTVLAGPD